MSLTAFWNEYALGIIEEYKIIDNYETIDQYNFASDIYEKVQTRNNYKTINMKLSNFNWMFNFNAGDKELLRIFQDGSLLYTSFVEIIKLESWTNWTANIKFIEIEQPIDYNCPNNFISSVISSNEVMWWDDNKMEEIIKKEQIPKVVKDICKKYIRKIVLD